MNLHFEELTGTDGARIGIASLDAENTLNALSLPMIRALTEQLDNWAKEPQVVCVLLRQRRQGILVRRRRSAQPGPGLSRPTRRSPAPGRTTSCGGVPPGFPPAHLPQAADLLGPWLCARGAWACCKARAPASSPPAAAWPCLRSASACTRCRRQLVPFTPARQARAVPRLDRRPDERPRCPRPGPG